MVEENKVINGINTQVKVPLEKWVVSIVKETVKEQWEKHKENCPYLVAKPQLDKDHELIGKLDKKMIALIAILATIGGALGNGVISIIFKT